MKNSLSAVDEIVRDCLAVRVRLIARAITAIYDGELEQHGATVAQINLLAAIGKLGPCSPRQVGDALQLERSTVSRNLDLLTRQRWVHAVSSDAKGIREVELTERGREKLDSIRTDWRLAQRKAQALLGDAGVLTVRDVASGLMGISRS